MTNGISVIYSAVIMRKADTIPLLGLHKAEKHVFGVLEDDVTYGMVELIAKTKLPRSTVVDTLKRLQARGLLRAVGVGKKTLWKRASYNVVQRHMTRAVSELMGTTLAAHQKKAYDHLATSASIDISVIYGTYNILKKFNRMSVGLPDERIFLTQIGRAFRELHTTHPQAVAELKGTNRLIRENKMIFEMIFTQSIKKEFAILAADPEWVSSATNQRIDGVEVSDLDLPDEPTQLCIRDDEMMLIDWRTQTAILIKNKEMASMQKALFRAAKAKGESFDVQRFILAAAEKYRVAQEQ